jgi:hypothetical protein
MHVHRNAMQSSELVCEKELAMAVRNIRLGFLNIRAMKETAFEDHGVSVDTHRVVISSIRQR